MAREHFPEFLTIPQAAELLTVSEPTVRRLIDQREIAFFKVGGSIRFSREDLLAYLKRRKTEPIM